MSLLKPKPHQVFSWALLIGLKKVKLEVKGTFWSNSFPIFPPEMRISRPWNMLGILSIYIYLYIFLLQCPGAHSLRVSENRRYFLRYPPGIKRGSKLPFLSISIHFYLWIIDRDNNSNIIYYILIILSINYL